MRNDDAVRRDDMRSGAPAFDGLLVRVSYWAKVIVVCPPEPARTGVRNRVPRECASDAACRIVCAVDHGPVLDPGRRGGPRRILADADDRGPLEGLELWQVLCRARG